MKSFEATPFLESRCTSMQRHYDNLLKDFQTEEIYQFRLQIKKLQAFLCLLNTDKTTKRKIRINKRLDAFYQTIGGLRNMQLHREDVLRLCGKLHLVPPHGYFRTLQERENGLKAEAAQMALHPMLHKFCHKLFTAEPKQVGAKIIENFVAGHKHRLLKILVANNYNDEALCSIRKMIKRMLYLWPWVADEMATLPQSACMDKGTCLELCEKIGDYQTLCITFRFFDTYNLNKPSITREANVLQALKKHTHEEKQSLKEKLVEDLQSCVRRIWENEDLLPIYEYL